MIVSRTPLRVSFFGGGSDYPAHYYRHGGAVLSTAVDKYIYITARFRPVLDDRLHRVVWRHVEEVRSAQEILHPAVRAILAHMAYDDSRGLEMHYQADLPGRAGMGSSSAFVVGLLNTLEYLLRGRRLPAKDLARTAMFVERITLEENVGSQDQIAAAFGGVNRMTFRTNGHIDVEEVGLSEEAASYLTDRLMLFFTGKYRSGPQHAGDVLDGIERKASLLNEMRDLVDEACTLLEKERFDDFGRLLHETWMMKRKQGKRITNDLLDWYYERGLNAGALGGKLLGAGGGGFMVFYVQEGLEERVEEAMIGCKHIPFRVSGGGSTVFDSEGHDANHTGGSTTIWPVRGDKDRLT